MSISDESTIVTNNDVSNGKNSQTDSPKSLSWRSVIIGGVPGLLLGSAGTVFASSLHENELDVEDAVKENPTDEVVDLKEEISTLKDEVSELKEQLASHIEGGHIPPIGPTVRVAHGVSDGMSFSEAFASARSEVGPGGVFTWRGNVYGTYYKDEWDSMTDVQKHEYAQAVHNTDYEYSPDHANEGDSTDGGEVHVIGEEHVEADNGQTIHVTRVEMDGHYGEVYDLNNDGRNDAALLDLNDDGQPDIAIVDENNDGMIDENEVYQVNNPSMMDVDNELYGDMPDYTNDADPSSFI